MLLGPTWSLVLRDTKTVLGRAHRTEQDGNDARFSRLGKHHSATPGRSLLRPSSAKPSSTNSFTSDTAPEHPSPLYWRREWAKLQHSTDIPHTGPNIHHTQLEDVKVHSATQFLSNTTQETSDWVAKDTSRHPDESSSFSPSKSSDIHHLSSEKDDAELKRSLEPIRSKGTESASSSSFASIQSDSANNRNAGLNGGDRTLYIRVDVDLGPDPLISHCHAIISYDSELCLWDIICHSKNGLFVNGRTIYPSDGPALLSSKSRIQIGSVLFLFLLPYRASISPSSSNSELPYITSHAIGDNLVVDEDKFQAFPSTSSQPLSQSSLRKRKYQDRSIVPWARISTSEEDKSHKRPFFGDHVSRRPHSMRSILFGGPDGDEELKQYLGDSILDDASDASKPAHLRQSFSPRLDDFRDSDMQYRSSLPEPSVRSVGSKGDVGGDGSVGRPRVGRGPRVHEGTDSRGAVHERPRMTYGQLIHMALESSPEKRLLFPQITDFITRTFPYYTTAAAGNWQNSLRHGLSNTTDFVRQERAKPTGKGKGGYWALASWYDGDRLLTRPKHR